MEKIYKEDVLELINDNIEVPVDAYDQAQMDALEWLKYEVKNLQPAEEIICCKSSFNSAPCRNCLNNPKNGGSGICHCTLGSNITC